MRGCAWLAVLAACGSSSEKLPITSGDAGIPAPFDPGTTYAPDVTPERLTAAISNPLFPLPVGARWVYEAHTSDGLERTVVEVLPGEKQVWGTTARIVRDTLSLDGEMIEDTLDWFAQDDEGHVWYMGEDTKEYENGHVVSTAGSWESGKGGALPGVIMLAQPRVGDVYRQEFLAGEAEDIGEVVGLGEAVTVPAGSWTGCMRTRDRSAIETADEHKVYCPGVGNVLELEGKVRVELVEVSGL